MRDARIEAMRTTLNLDERAAVAARARARHRRISLGEAVSELVLAGLAAEDGARPEPHPAGLTLLPSAEGHVLTTEMVAEALDED